MKKWGILLLAGLAGVFVLAGCQQPTDLSNYAKLSDLQNTKVDCQVCHVSSYVTNGDYALANTTQFPSATKESEYLFSGHNLGLREDFFSSAILVSTPSINNGAQDETSASCSKCHTGDGFVDWVKNGSSSASDPNASIATTATNAVTVSGTTTYSGEIGCTACHDPMYNGNYNLRTTAAAVMPSGNTYSSGGKGNLCATCHQDRTTVSQLAAKFTPAGTNTYVSPFSAYGATHHGPQSDFLLGVDNSGFSTTNANGYKINNAAPAFAQSPHYVQDSCVTCHVLENSSTTAGEQSSHGMYLLTASAANTPVDHISTCAYCHDTASATNIGIASGTFPYVSTGTSFQTAIGSGGGQELADIYQAYSTLLNYFAVSGNFTGSATTATAATAAPVSVTTTIVSTGLSDISNRFNVDWAYHGTGYYLTPSQAQAYWNLMLFAEDKSVGVHNPVYASQLLFDAITLINADTATFAHTGSTVAAATTWPTAGLAMPTDWTARPN
ncbi:MAG TPA: hypothetical protein VMV83_03290 [Rectinemataceae bacterium]|nr:hypothetical protein [Rectinemataceae bacterium]